MGIGMKYKLALNTGIEIHSKDFHPGLQKWLCQLPYMKGELSSI